MEAIISLLINYYIISVGVSAAIKGLKVLKARKIIKSNGFEITKGDLEIQEEIACAMERREICMSSVLFIIL